MEAEMSLEHAKQRCWEAHGFRLRQQAIQHPTQRTQFNMNFLLLPLFTHDHTQLKVKIPHPKSSRTDNTKG